MRNRWLLPIFGMLAALVLTSSQSALAAEPDFQLDCVQAKGELGVIGTTFANCTVTALNGYEGRVFISCTLPEGMTCHSDWNPLLSNTLLMQSFKLYASGETQWLHWRHDLNGTLMTIPVPIEGRNSDGSIIRNIVLEPTFTFIIPESPIGIIVLIGSSFAAMSLFIVLRRKV